MDRECTRNHLQAIALWSFDWKTVGRRLLLSDQSIIDIDRDEKDEQNKRDNMLTTWHQQKGPKATYQVLMDTFQTLNIGTLVDKLKILTEECNTGDIAQPRVMQVNKNPGDSVVTHRCGCNECDLMSLIQNGCPECRNTNTFPFLEIEALTEGEVKQFLSILDREGKQMSRAFDKIRNSFVTMMEKKVDLMPFKSAMKRITGFRSYKLNICMLEDRTDEIDSAKDKNELVKIIKEYITWFNCDLLKEIVFECVQIEKLEHEDYRTFCHWLKQYEDARMLYCRRGIFECPNSLFPKNERKCKKLFCLIVSDNKINNFEHLDAFEGGLCLELGIKRCNLIMCSIGKGCIELVYLLPSCVHELLFPLNAKQLQGLAMIGVTEISIGASYESINTLQNNEHGTLSLNTSSDNSGHDNFKQELAACQKDFEILKSHCSEMINASVEELTKCVAEVPQKPHYQQYILKCSGNLRQCSTVDEFFATLCSSYSNYLFYQLFEKVVTRANSMLMSDMKKYKKKLTSITTVARVQELNDRSVCMRNTTADCEVLIAVQVPFSDCRISDIEEVRDEIRRISYMFEFCHRLCEISGDSNTTTTKWLISNVYSRHLQVDLLLSTIPLGRKLLTKNDAPQQLLMAFGVMKICIDGLCVFESDPNCKEMVHLRRSVLKQNTATNSESQLNHLTMSDDLSFKESSIKRVLQFSTDQWHEFALLLGLSLQEIADCWSAQTVHCKYPNILLKRWLSTDDSASWYTLMTIVKAMLPPACDYADKIVQDHPSITEVNEAELKDLQETIPSTLRLPASVLEDTIEMEQMDVVDGVVANVAKAVDERFKAIEEVLRASKDELKQKSNSEDYWRKQEQLDNDLIYALSKQNDEIENLLKRTAKLCSDLDSRNDELQGLINKVKEECQKIDELNKKVWSKKTIFEELNEQLIRLQRLKSQNAERLAALTSIPSKVYQLKQDAEKNYQLCKTAERNISVVLHRQAELLNRITILLAQNEDRLNGVIHGLLKMLDKWKDYYNTRTGRTAIMAGAAGVAAATFATIVTWGLAAPFSVGFGAAVAAGAGGAVLGGAYGWNTYEQIGRKNVNRFSEHERMGKEKRRRLTEQAGEIQRQIQTIIRSI